MVKGKLIVIDGVDLANKSSQISYLLDYLNRHKIPSLAFSEINSETTKSYLIRAPVDLQRKIIDTIEYRDYMRLSYKIRDIIVDEFLTLPSEATTLLVTSLRTVTTPLLRQLLEDGINVILDRYTYSTFVYQHYIEDKDIRTLKALSPFTLEDMIDIGIILTLSEKEYAERVKHVKNSILYDNWTYHYTKVLEGFSTLKQYFPHNIVVINADSDEEVTFSKILECLKENNILLN